MEHSAVLSTFIKLLFVIKIFVLSTFEWPFYTGFTVFAASKCGDFKRLSYWCSLILAVSQFMFSILIGATC